MITSIQIFIHNYFAIIKWNVITHVVFKLIVVFAYYWATNWNIYENNSLNKVERAELSQKSH